ncbi:uncharacterized protein LOC116299634 [Actinia tenebrosa]|uniref:Uncharacterized protein LOC116299634 n=1 Tax=Actinia tenebrosa TaxID=6105 RepID=A0A6P8IDE1_ACTTE|nr:uncharacterized protein LOC116299634 [Actinia tenebrosa]XP_031564182.1 uncharacterized protein LOC116299634 [Actinia tenebrosa]
MSKPLRLANEAKCACTNDNPLRFRRFHDRERDELLGLQCLICDKEYLKKTFVLISRDGHILQSGRHKFYLAERSHIPEDGVHMVHSAKTAIENGDNLKPGDHIAWKRPLGHWHHAIVTETNDSGNEVRVVHWHGDKSGIITPDCKIQEEWIDLKKQKGSLYLMDYSEEILNTNPARLVIARARSRIGDKGYHLVTDNCETFASFCKFGVAISQQIIWACKELKNECKKSGLKTFAKVGLAELTEQAVYQEQWLGFSLVVVLEGIHTCIDIKDLWKARREGKMTKKIVIEQITERLTQAVFCGGLAGVGSVVPKVGFIVGFFGGIVGKWIGSMVGPSVGQFIASLVEYDDRAICKITNLRSGDHLVLPYDSEESHHCIAQWYNEETNHINVIHNTEKYGVIQEWIEFVQPTYKVIYEEKEGCTPDEAWSKAVSNLGRKQYDAECFNSKHFAQMCCKK